MFSNFTDPGWDQVTIKQFCHFNLSICVIFAFVLSTMRLFKNTGSGVRSIWISLYFISYAAVDKNNLSEL